jgi:type II secretory pathway pseudopilin PulG
MVVIALIGIVLVVTAPTARNVFTADSLKKASRQLIGLERKLRVEAVRDQIDYILCLDLPTSSYWILTADMTAEKENEVKKSAKKLSAGVRILDIVFPENKKFSEGEVRIRFGKNSICPPMVIHLGDEEEKMTIVVNPFMGVTGIYEEYKDISLEEGMGTERVRL